MHILKEAYRLFLFNNMEKVTITELEKATQRIRGTIFYHFKNKQEIFEAVVDEVFFPSFDIPPKIVELAGNSTIMEFIDSYVAPENRVSRRIRNTYSVKNAEIGYFNFLSQACKYYPGFNEKYTEIITRDYSLWETVLNRNEVKKGSFKQIIDSIMLLNTGMACKRGYNEDIGLNCKDFILTFLLNPKQ